MRKCMVILAVGLCAAAVAAQAKDLAPAAWTFSAAPSFSYPLLAGDFSANNLFSSAWGGEFLAEYSLPAGSPFRLRVGAGYAYGGYLPEGDIEIPGSLSEISAIIGASVGMPLGAWVGVHGIVDGGVGVGILSSGGTYAFPVVRIGGGLDVLLLKSLAAGIDAFWVERFGVYGGLGITIDVGYRLPIVRAAGPALRLLDVRTLKLAPLFPIFRSFYDENPIGSATITNTSTRSAMDMKVTLMIRQYMDAPKECASIPEIAPGASVDVPLFALFDDRILNVTEATKVNAELSVTYSGEGSLSRTATVLVYDRNALTWDDDRHAAAFVSSKDPWVLDLTGNFLAAVKGSLNVGVAKNLQTAIAIHEGMRAYGMSYVLSPNRPFLKEGGNLSAIDSLKFPRQTLAFKAGDCADLSVLYASCLESAGIDTALVTVPGHIFMALDLGMDPEEARSRAMSDGDLIVAGGKAWVPVETTMQDSGFIDAWRKAAAEWRDSSAKGQAAFYPTHEAWSVFAPVGLPANESAVQVPPGGKVKAGFEAQLSKEVETEIAAHLARLGPIPEKSPKTAKMLNARGIVYGKYGMYKEAERDFKAAADTNHAPALMNLGTLSLLRSDAATAYAYFRQALPLAPENVGLLVSVARAAAALGKKAEAAATVEAIKKIDPQAASRVDAVTAPVGSGEARAAEIGPDAAVWF